MSGLRAALSTPAGTFSLLLGAAYLEVQGDACFQSGLHESMPGRKAGWFACGAIVLVTYSLLLNSSGIVFSKALGMYVVLFFLIAQVVAKVQFQQNPTLPIYLGGGFIVLGGLIIAGWKH